MTFVSQILEAKGSELHFLSPDATVFEALERMARRTSARCWCSTGRPVGIFSERDYARKVILQGQGLARRRRCARS